ncbi:MAG: relaxase/mobilization nuclease domain-containing protein [Longimicrobiales bacterium]
MRRRERRQSTGVALSQRSLDKGPASSAGGTVDRQGHERSRVRRPRPLSRNRGRDDGDRSDRVLWTEARNLPTDDPHTASVLMRATAAQSARTEKPVYHIALSFSPENAVDRATMVQAADGLMNDLGLREPQALIIAHGDSRHPHVHLMINRVHPEAFRPWLVWDWRSRWRERLGSDSI